MARRLPGRLQGVLLRAIVVAALLGAGVVAGVAIAGSTAEAPPTVSPIVAQFDQNARATSYQVTATDNAGKPLTYAWKLDPPKDDPNCKEFFVTPGQPNRAVWAHGEDNGCSHKTTQHEGDVSVVVSDVLFSCTATYHGTESGTGPAPGTCTDLRPPTSTKTTSTTPRPTPHVVNPVEDPTILYKRVMGELSKENLQIAKDGGILSFIPYVKDAVKATGGLKEKDTFVEKILDKIGLSKRGYGTAFFKKAFAVVSIVGDSTAIVFDVAALYQGLQAADPPRYDFQVLTRPAALAPRLPASVAAGAPKPVVVAANALLENAAQLKSTSAALVTTFERVQGAYRAGNAKAEAAQAALAARYADAAARLLGAQAALRSNLLASVRPYFSKPVTIPASLVAGVSRGQRDLAPDLLDLLGQFKLTAKRAASVRANLSAPVSSPIVFPDFFATSRQAAGDARGVKALRGFATFLRGIAAG